MDGPEFVVVPQAIKPKTKVQKIITIIAVSLGILLLLGGAYSSLIYYVLLDYVTMPYITFSYRSSSECVLFIKLSSSKTTELLSSPRLLPSKSGLRM